MKSVVMRSTSNRGAIGAEVVDVAVPSLGPGDLLVEMKACGLCGTDIEKMLGHYTASMPVLGHEAVGVISEMGEGVVGIRKGDRVFPHHHVPCGVCYHCKNGSQTMCDEYRTSNIHPGGFSEFFRVPAFNVSRGGVLKLPDELEFGVASLIEPLACCIRAQSRCEIRGEETALVVGAGPVGMAHALLLKSRGSRVMISDVSEARLEFARNENFDFVLDARTDAVPESVRKVTSGRGADVVIVASGSQKAIIQSLRSVRRGGRVCLFGVPSKGSVLDYDIGDLFNSEISIITNYGATEKETKEALEVLLANPAAFTSLITDRFPLGKFGEAVERASVAGGMKVVLTP